VRREEDLAGNPAPGRVVELHIDDEELRVAVVTVGEAAGTDVGERKRALAGRTAVPVIGWQIGDADDCVRPVFVWLHPVVVLTALPADARVVVAIVGDLETGRKRGRQRVFAPVVHRVAVGIPSTQRTAVKASDVIPAGDEQAFGR
jgi:hypothetical protein